MSGQLSLRDFLSVEQSQFSGPLHGWGRWDARWKVAITLAAMGANVLVARAWLTAILLGLAALGFVYSRSPWRHIFLFLLAPVWATLALVAGMSFGFGVHPIGHLLGLTFYREGVEAGLNAGLRVLTDVSWAGLLVITTPFTRILAALRWFRVPEGMLDTLSYMYRYVFLLFDEFTVMRNAARARGGLGNFRRVASTSGQIAAQIFLRAYDRAGRISMAIKARGGDRQDTATQA